MCSPAWAEEEPRPQLQVLEGPGVACTLPSCAGAFPGVCPPGARWALGVSGSPLHTQEQTSPRTPPFKGKATAVDSFQGAQKGPASPTPRPHPTGSPNTTAARWGLSAPAPDDVSTLQSTEGSPWPSRTAGGIPGLSPSRPPLLCRGRGGGRGRQVPRGRRPPALKGPRPRARRRPVQERARRAWASCAGASHSAACGPRPPQDTIVFNVHLGADTAPSTAHFRPSAATR